jgi:hypothetical protein
MRRLRRVWTRDRDQSCSHRVLHEQPGRHRCFRPPRRHFRLAASARPVHGSSERLPKSFRETVQIASFIAGFVSLDHRLSAFELTITELCRSCTEP